MEEKGKPSKKESPISFSTSSKTPFLMRSFSTKSTSSSKSPLLIRSSSTKTSSSSSKCPLPRSLSHKTSSSSSSSRSLGKKCSNLAKEQKTKLYIMKRCVAMLMCWHKHGDS